VTRAVLVHGASANGATWASFAERLRSLGWKVEAPDLSGGTAEKMADGLVASVAAGPDVAIGHSLGGAVLLLAWDRLRPRRAVYADPAWRFHLSPDRQAAGRRFLDSATREQWRQVLPQVPEADLDAFMAAARRWDGGGPTELDLVPAQPPPVPSLLLLSTETAFEPPVGYQVARLRGVGHFMLWEDPEQCVQAIAAFLAG
jgi:pimeloyl-ACP methyl ester carboxylesterase